jgi:hypothetical protein
MSNKKPQPLYAPNTPARCPVCGEFSYSSAGVHPQCAERQADDKRMTRAKAGARSERRGKSATPTRTMHAWQRACPKCRALQHVRKKVCSCGHTLAAVRRTETTESDAS